jgi:hypothetical protein
MAVKKAATPQTGSNKAETKEAAPKQSAPKKASPEQAKAKPAAAKKAPAIKLSDAQTRVLGAVREAGEGGYAAGKGQASTLESLLNKKLVKRGKKVDGVARFLITKAGEKHAATAAAPPAPAPPSPVPPSPAPEASPAPAPSPMA